MLGDGEAARRPIQVQAHVLAFGPGRTARDDPEVAVVVEEALGEFLEIHAPIPRLPHRAGHRVPEREGAVLVGGVARLVCRVLAVVREDEELAVRAFQPIEVVGREHDTVEAVPVRSGVTMSPRV